MKFDRDMRRRRNMAIHAKKKKIEWELDTYNPIRQHSRVKYLLNKRSRIIKRIEKEIGKFATSLLFYDASIKDLCDFLYEVKVGSTRIQKIKERTKI